MRLQAELDHLRTVRRREIADEIQRAKDLPGALSNNPEYEQAKEEQAFVEGRILTLEAMLRNPVVIDDDQRTSGTTAQRVRFGSHVRLSIDGRGDLSYQIVGPAEANPSEGRISNESPVGRALMGKKVGDSVQVVTPGGTMKMKVKAIE